MKITSIDVYDFGKCLNYEDCSPICIRINTDAGISGIGVESKKGEGSTFYFTLPSKLEYMEYGKF